MIKVKNLTKSFGVVKAVDNVSFTIRPGEIVGLLGPNGAGKTTVMRLLTGFLLPDHGLIQIEQKAGIGYLPENNPLYQEMLVVELLNFSAEIKQLSPGERKKAFDFVVSVLGLNEVFYRPISELSKGFRQRVGLALALLCQPKILILDEPTEGLDPNQRLEMRQLIKKMAKGRTIIMSTHVMPEAAAVCNRILIINQGKLVADATPKKLAVLAKSRKLFWLEDVFYKLTRVKK